MLTKKTKFKETEIGVIPESWDVCSIEKALNIIDGDRGVDYPSGTDFSTEGYCLFLNAKNVIGSTFDFSNCQFISKEKDLELRKGKMQRGDFALTTRGTVGNIAFYDKSVHFENIRINSGMVILRNDKNFDSKYLFQLLKSSIIKKQILGLTTGSAQPQLPIRDLKNIKLIKPTFFEQQKIAEILSSLDDKIELNLKINDNLEKIVSSLFKRWFVDFEFPDKDGKPYKTSGGKMIDSELGKIPDEWKIGIVSDLVSIDSGFSFSSSVFDEDGKYGLVTIKNVQDGAFIRQCSNYIKYLPDKMPDYCKLKNGDILLSLTGNVGRICVVNGKNFLLNQRVAALNPYKEFNRAFTYFLFRQKDFQDILINISRGTAQQNLSPIETKKLKIVIPEEETLKYFGETANNIFLNLLNNLKEIEVLTKLRDSLLPKLMNGKIRVK